MRQGTGAGVMAGDGSLCATCDVSGLGAGGEDSGLGGSGNWPLPGATTGGGTSA